VIDLECGWLDIPAEGYLGVAAVLVSDNSILARRTKQI
jgi:hypothetical protein